MTKPAKGPSFKGAIIGALAGAAVGLIVIVVLGFGLGIDLSGSHSWILMVCTVVGVMAGMFKGLIGSSETDGA